MGLTYANISLTNIFNHKKVETSALVDTGALFMCVPEAIAVQLGFDTTEVRTQIVTLADGRQIHAPKIAPVEIMFDNRSYITEAIVLGDEPLLGVFANGSDDLIVDPRNQTLAVNPLHPNYSVAKAK